MPTITIPGKSGALQALERAEAEAIAANQAVLARRDPSGVDAPSQALIAEAKRTTRAAEEASARAKERRREEGRERGVKLVRTPEFRKILEAKVIDDAKRMEATAALLNAIEVAGADAVRVPEVYGPKQEELRELETFAIRTRAQGVDTKVLPSEVAAWIERHA